MVSEAQKRANKKYRSGLKNISIQIKPERYAEISAAAERAGMSVRAYVLEAIEDRMERDNLTDDPSPDR